MSDTPSWWLKYDRAQAHRREAEAMIDAATAPQPIRIEKSLRDGVWEYTVHHDANLGPSFPVVVGDLVFNLRSALDHAAAANRIKKTMRVPFPIFHDPIMVIPPPGDPDPFRRYRDTWNQVKANTRPDVFKLMDDAQPFNAGPEYDPANTALATLNELQNRDKHASLAVLTTGIGSIQSWVIAPDGTRFEIPGPDLGAGFFPNGATIFRESVEMQIEIEGRVKLAVTAGPTGALRGLPEAFEDMSLEVQAFLGEVTRVMAARTS